MTINYKQKISIYSVVLIIVLVASFVFLINPILTNVKEIRTKIEESTISLEVNKRQTQNISDIKKNLDSLNKKNDTLDEMFISENNELLLFKDLENLALKNSLEQTFSLETPAGETTPQEVKLTIELTGNPRNFIKYIAGIESINYYLKIKSLNLAVSDKDQSSITIEALTYWQ